MKPILVVVGGVQSRDRLVEVLLRAGYNVAQADSGKSALSIARSNPPGLIFIAIVMPDISGLEIAAKLREILASTPPIILLGSIPPIGLHDEPLASLVDGYLNINVTSSELLATVESQI